MVTIIIPCRNEQAHIEAALTSIFSQAQVEGGFEVIVADGMSDDDTREILRRMAERDDRMHIVDNPGRIVSTGLNAAIRAARGDIIVRMDAHTEYASDYVQQCVAVLARSGADNVGGPARTKASGYLQTAVSLAYHSPFAVGGARFHDTEFEGAVDTVTYGCWKKTTLEQLGLFDEELVRNQDDELNLRLVRRGGRIWQSPAIKSWYFPRGSLASLFRQYQQYGYWKVRVIQKHRLPASVRHLIPGGFVVALLSLTAAAPFSAFALRFLMVLVLTYAAAAVAASLITCRRSVNWRYLPVMPAVFATYHVGYGWGFLSGVLDFVLLRRKGRESSKVLTRG